MTAFTDSAVRESGGPNVPETPEAEWLGRELALFIRNAPDAKVVTDLSGRIRFVNAPLTRLFGYAEQVLHGRNITELVADAAGSAAEQILAALLQRSEPGAPRTVLQTDGMHRDGWRFGIEIAVTPLGDIADGISVWSVRPVVDLERDLEFAGRSQARLNEAQRIAKIGSWEWDVLADEHWWSDELYRMLEIDQSSSEELYEHFINRIHPDERERFAATSERVRRTGQTPPAEMRIVLPDGTEKIVQSQGEAVLDAEGNPVRIFGTLQDITERKHVEAQLRLSESRYKEAQQIGRASCRERV